MSVGTTYRRVVSWAKGRNPLCFEDVRVDSEVLGSEYGAHCVCTRGLGNGSVVYSFGVGTDASFDLALIERFGVELHAFDPTPRSIEWVQQQTWPEGFTFHPLGIANYDGEGRFSPPTNPDHVSHTLLDRPATADRSFEVEVRTLASLLKELRHERLDVLKMDVEGSEYDVIDQVLQQGIAIDQILVEYHHQFKSVPISKTSKNVADLRRHGYRLFHISETGREYSFVHERLLVN